ncbi:MAG: ABC transporter substrate-binding protein [Treponema sp.]|nr:ABC transporter substrate-binding protein [Spirochaetales bacterium]MDY4903135.1 ABC transporter substrate-binding protein [Treponema sp.]
MRKSVFVIACVAAASLISCNKSTGNTIKVGGIAPLSGEVAVYGVECKNGIDLAVEEINAAGGVLGQQFEFIFEDDQGKSDQSVNVYKKLVAKDGVGLIVGSLTSGCTQAVAQQAQSNEVLQIAPAATATSVTSVGNYVFRACYTDPFQGRVAGKFAAVNLGAKKAAVLYDIGNDYSSGLKDNFVSEFQAQNGTVVSIESYKTNDKDFNTQLTKIKSLNPDVVYLPDYYGTVALIASQLRSVGITAPIVGADGWDGLTGMDGVGDEVVGGYYSNHYADDSDKEVVQEFVKKFNDKYGKKPNSFAALGYDSVYMLKDAIVKAGSTEPAAVRDALASIDGDYVTGHIVFDEDRNPVKDAVMVEIKKGEDGKLFTAYKTTVSIN